MDAATTGRAGSEPRESAALRAALAPYRVAERKDVAGSIGAAYEASAAHEHDGVVIGLVGVAAAGGEAVGDVGERQAAVVEEPMGA